jgi:polyphosphate glucokinase
MQLRVLMHTRFVCGIVTAALTLFVACRSSAPADGTAAKADKKVLVVDIGGTSVKILATGQNAPRSFPSGSSMTPAEMVAGVDALAKGWEYDVVSIGYPGRVTRGNVVAEPHNLAPGWVGFDFHAAFKRPVQVVNDAAMQALGSYQGGTMLFLGLGTGLGSALVVEGNVVPMELGHLSYQDATYEDYVGIRGLQKLGKEQWEQHVQSIVARFVEALNPDDVVLGGGNVARLTKLPLRCRAGSNDNAFTGGFRLWEARR